MADKHSSVSVVNRSQSMDGRRFDPSPGAETHDLTCSCPLPCLQKSKNNNDSKDLLVKMSILQIAVCAVSRSSKGPDAQHEFVHDKKARGWNEWAADLMNGTYVIHRAFHEACHPLEIEICDGGYGF